ncbi:WavE lipopolysaccharide synthesis family protein [Marinimicrobium sp. ARAG 43.8]|uniref:WavE lipopolysaccharide synthesis family protein n=1 Tax=Marinimicrobium sp. ARAG 43.8 TaxID=3418719 RepID=UPI003CF94462
MIDFKDISVVVQGPVQTFENRKQDSGITQKCLESVREHLPGSTLILSTWGDQNLKGLDFDELVINDDPGPNIRYFKLDGTPRYFNNNRQIVTSRGGLRRVKTLYAVKLRSDNYLTGNRFVELQKEYRLRSSEHKYLQERVVVSNIFTRRYAKGYPVAYHLSDFFYFGLTQDILSIWDLPLYDDATDPKQQSEFSEKSGFPIDCTQMFWISALQKFNPSISLGGLLDTSNGALGDSDICFANNFVIASPEQLGLGLCKKFLGKARISRTKGQCAQWQHIEWINSYKKHCAANYSKLSLHPDLIKLWLHRAWHVLPTRLETQIKVSKRARKFRESHNG